MADAEKNIKQYKIDAVAELKNEFSDNKDLFFADFRGVSVAQVNEIRKDLAAHNSTLKVVKNRYAKIALRDLNAPNVDEFLKGPTAVAIAGGESGPVAKILFKCTKTMPLKIKGGIVANDTFDSAKVEAYSKLPTRIELIAKLMGTMNAPVATFVRTLQAVVDSRAEEN
ncbi:MAG: 50S ribosomal protein L10 [Spirochaetales bacterium]|nr:50S ribosomal protein L10 [Spirochaetales bacterium]